MLQVKLQSQIKSYQDEINKLMANGYMAEYSTEWFEAQAALNGFRQEAAEAEKTLIELQDQLRELDLLKLQQVIDELDRTAKRLENNSDLTESKGEQVSERRNCKSRLIMRMHRFRRIIISGMNCLKNRRNMM